MRESAELLRRGLCRSRNLVVDSASLFSAGVWEPLLARRHLDSRPELVRHCVTDLGPQATKNSGAQLPDPSSQAIITSREEPAK